MEDGAEYTLDLPEKHNAFLYVLAGDVDAGENGVNLKKHGVATLTFKEDGEGTSELKFKSKKRRTKVLVYSGAPIREDIVPHGPFVMNTMEEIKQAYVDFRNGKFGPPAV